VTPPDQAGLRPRPGSALRDDSNNLPGSSVDLVDIQRRFDRAYAGHEPDFRNALLMARDYLGRLLALTLGNLSPDFLTYHDVLRGLIRADREISGGENQPIIRDSFAWREISPASTSLLLRPHTLQDCGLRALQVPDGATRVIMTDDAVARLAAGDGWRASAMAGDR
jgi:hypothetical protein